MNVNDSVQVDNSNFEEPVSSLLSIVSAKIKCIENNVSTIDARNQSDMCLDMYLSQIKVSISIIKESISILEDRLL